MIRSKRLFPSTLVIGGLLVLAPTARGQEPKDATSSHLEDHLKLVRGDLVQRRESALRTLIKVDESQAKVLWPLKDQYDTELKALAASREAVLREYAKAHKSLTPEVAKDLATRSLKLDEDRNNLRKKYFDLMSQKVSVIAAAQFLQLERQYETMMDLKVQSVVPLAGW